MLKFSSDTQRIRRGTKAAVVSVTGLNGDEDELLVDVLPLKTVLYSHLMVDAQRR